MSQPELWKLFLLPAYVVAETTRGLLVFSAVQSQIRVSTVLVALFSELVKLFVAMFFLSRSHKFDMNAVSEQLFYSAELKPYLTTCIPAVLYLVNSLLYMVALSLTTPAFLYIAILAKTPITAVFHHFLVRKQASGYAWAALALMTIGMIVYDLPSDFVSLTVFGSQPSDIDNPAPVEQITSAAGFFIGILISLISGFTSTYTEMILKQKTPFWVAQTWLYTFGSLASVAIYSVWGGYNKTDTELSNSILQTVCLHASLIAVTSGTGLLIANILRKKDNLVKLVGTSASIIVIIVVEVLVFPAHRATTLNPQTMVGVVTIGVSTWAYNQFKDPKPQADSEETNAADQKELSDESIEEGPEDFIEGLDYSLIEDV
jgi:solute carrier family 35 (UDP-sugar transporter), member A1/2/3